jgi:predicted transcriptional regulator
MKNTELVADLKKFGLSENEAKAYIGLVLLGEPSVRELHEITEIPRAKVYDVVSGLIEKRYAEVIHGTPTHYKPTDPEDLMQMLREDYEKTAGSILKSFEELDMTSFIEDHDDTVSMLYLRSEWTIRKKIAELFEETNKRLIVLSHSPEIVRDIKNELTDISKKKDVWILAENTAEYENYPLPIRPYPKNIYSLLKDLGEGHIAHQTCFILADSKKAIAIKKVGDQMEARYFAQAALGFLYKTLYYFILNADNIVVPEEFMESENERKECERCKKDNGKTEQKAKTKKDSKANKKG